MPAGVDVAVEDGFATIAFVDPSLRGPGLAALFAAGTPPELVEKVTRPRVAYTVPEGKARLAGLLDEAPKYAEGGVVSASADGTWTELVGTDTGGPYTILPEVPDASYGPDSIPLDPQTAASEPTGDAQGSQADQASEPLGAIIGTADANDAASSGGVELIEIPGGGAVEPATQVWPDGDPEIEWKRPELDAYAASKGIDTRELPNKRDVLAAITKAAE